MPGLGQSRPLPRVQDCIINCMLFNFAMLQDYGTPCRGIGAGDHPTVPFGCLGCFEFICSFVRTNSCGCSAGSELCADGWSRVGVVGWRPFSASRRLDKAALTSFWTRMHQQKSEKT
jgi:hypothetical protein